jgi:transposase
MGMIAKDDGWRIPDELWEKMEPLLPPPKFHPLGCHNPAKDPRVVMNAILFVLRTGCMWNSLNGSGLCGSSVAHRWFTQWAEAGVFKQFWRDGLLAYDLLVGIDWSWCSADGAMTKAPLGGEKNRPQSNRPGQKRGQTQCTDRC